MQKQPFQYPFIHVVIGLGESRTTLAVYDLNQGKFKSNSLKLPWTSLGLPLALRSITKGKLNTINIFRSGSSTPEGINKEGFSVMSLSSLLRMIEKYELRT